LRRLGAIPVFAVTLAVGLAACGGSENGTGEASSPSTQNSPPSIDEISACLKRAGGHSQPLEFQPGKTMAVAKAADGDDIFIIPLERPGEAEHARRVFKEAEIEEGQAGIEISRSVDDGYIFIAIIGVEGVDGGVPSVASEELAKECATRPPPDLRGSQPA
jgi:hypothetical protein